MAHDEYGDDDERGGGEHRAPRGNRRGDSYRGGFVDDVPEDPGAQRRWSAGGGFSGHIDGYGRGGHGPGEYGFDGGMARGPNTEWGGGFAGGYGRQGEHGRRGGYGRETGARMGEWSGEPGGGRAYDSPEAQRRPRGRMIGGGYGGLQGRSAGHDVDAWGDEVQGGSYGRAWGRGQAGGWPDADDRRPRRPAEERARQNFAGRGPRGYRRSDVRINEEINEALTRHPEIDATDIDVRVESGVVTLSGAVDDKYAKRLAEDIAEECYGVTEVRNDLRVGRDRPQ